MPHHKSWTLLSLGLFLIVLGTLMLILLVLQWEQYILDKKQKPSFTSFPPSLSYVEVEKEAKVTSLDPVLALSPSIPVESQDYLEIDSSKELALSQTISKVNQKQQEQVIKALEIKIQEVEKQEEENRQLELKVQQIAQDFADYKLFSEEQLKQKQIQLAALQQIIEDQRNEMEKRQEQIHQLDTKVHDLSYEIKTLLYLHEEKEVLTDPFALKEEKSPIFIHEAINAGEEFQQQAKIAMAEASFQNDAIESPVRNAVDAAHLLKKCINVAQKLTGANYYSQESFRYREFSSSYFAIDQRRLFDSLRTEAGALIIVYSQKEGKLLFANNESKTILGWNPEKLAMDFSSIIQDAAFEWKNALNTLIAAPDSQARLLAKTKQGQEILLNCHLGVIATGLFRNYVIGVLYPAM